MIGKELVEGKPITVHEVKPLLTSEDDTYEQTSTREYVEKVAKLDPEKARELVEKLVEAGYSRELAVKIVNIMPSSKTELYTILAKEDVKEDDYEKILSLLG